MSLCSCVYSFFIASPCSVRHSKTVNLHICYRSAFNVGRLINYFIKRRLPFKNINLIIYALVPHKKTMDQTF